MKVVAVVPVKMNNERTPGKNTKAFSDGTPLIHCVLKSLKQVESIDEIYVYCSNESIKDYLIDDIHYLKRDEKFDSQVSRLQIYVGNQLYGWYTIRQQMHKENM